MAAPLLLDDAQHRLVVSTCHPHLLIIYGIRRGRGRRGALFLLLLGCLVRGPVGDDLDADREEDDEHVDAHQREEKQEENPRDFYPLGARGCLLGALAEVALREIWASCRWCIR